MQSPSPAKQSGLSAEKQQIVSFVERDYEITQEVATGAHRAVVASRSVGFTLVAALLGFGLSQKSWPLLLLAAFSGFAVYLIDAYYTWRASERDAYVRGLEEVLGAHVAFLERTPRNERELGRLERRLAGLRVGTTSQIRTFKAKDVWFIQPAPLFRFLYPLLLLFALGACAYFVSHDLRHDRDPKWPRARKELVSEARSWPARQPAPPPPRGWRRWHFAPHDGPAGVAP
jgi:hypothetical protein